jgi:hypothetical protein
MHEILFLLLAEILRAQSKYIQSNQKQNPVHVRAFHEFSFQIHEQGLPFTGLLIQRNLNVSALSAYIQAQRFYWGFVFAFHAH